MRINQLVKLALLLSIVLLIATVPTLAQSYTLTGRPVSNAKAISSGDFILAGSVGQPEAGSALSGGGFTLNGGIEFEGPPSEVPSDNFPLYLPLILR